MEKFIMKSGKDGQYYFNLHAGNGEVILSSEGYTTKRACQNGISSVQKNAQSEESFEKLIAKNGKFYFRLKAANHQVIGKSEMYETEKSRDNGIASVIKNAPGASVETI